MKESKKGNSIRLPSEVGKLQSYITGLSDFQLSTAPAVQYNHMGATLTDAILQSGLTYETVVRPRVEHVLLTFPEAKLTSAFLTVLQTHGANKVIQWKDAEKPTRLLAVTELLSANNVQSEPELGTWLSTAQNVQSMRRLHGVGPKTVDYFRMLCGMSTTAIDRHIMRFLQDAGISPADYDEAHAIIERTAHLMGIGTSMLDSSIWTYMAGRSQPAR